MIKMSRIIFTLRGVVMSYQNGFGGNDLAGREAMMGGGVYNKRGLCCVCVSYLTIQIAPFLIFFCPDNNLIIEKLHSQKY